MMKALLFGSGTFSLEEKRHFETLHKCGGYSLVAIDGGLHHLTDLNLKADFHLGDFDSSKIESSLTTVHLPDQKFTDLEKSLNYLLAKNYSELHLFAFHGKRFDHAINNLEVFSRYANIQKMVFYTEHFRIYPAREHFSMLVDINKIISIFSFRSCEFKDSKGLEYSLKNVSMSFGKNAQGISNLSTQNSIDIEFKSGEALIFIEY